MNRKKIIVLIIPLIILIAFASAYFAAYSTGKSLYLKTVPYDPTDLFRGDYVTLQYEIEDLDISFLDKDLYSVTKESEYEYYNVLNNNVYIWYEDAKGYVEAVKVSSKKPSDNKYIEAELMYIAEDFVPQENPETKPVVYNYKAFLDIGLDRFYLQQGTGKTLEDMSRKGELIVEVKKLWNVYIIKGIFPAEELK